MVSFNEKEILIPLVDEVILKVDRKKKELHIRAPEGLIDIYL
jgi:16S rRNA processing protein RimM